MVMSLARCISAISAGDLNMRQPAVTATASTSSARGAALRSAVEDEEPQPLLDADAAGRDAAIGEDLRDQRVRALVFLPRADVGREPRQLARPLLLEGRRHPRELAAPRDDQQERPLAQAPARRR